MPNVGAEFTASIVIDKNDLIAQALKQLSTAQKELEKNKLEIYFDLSNADLSKKLKEYQKQLSSTDYTIKINNNGIEETYKSLDKLLDIVKTIASGKDFGTGNGIGNSIADEKQLKTIIDLFTKMESHLSSMKKVFSDVGDGQEFSPLLSTINKIDDSISKLSSSVKGIGLNMNIDFGSDKEMEAEAESKISNALQAYQRLFDHIKMSGAGGSIINQKFFDFDINQYDTAMSKLQAYRKFIDNIRKETKEQFNGKDVLYEDTDSKYWKQASAAAGQITKVFNEMKAASNTNPLENIFGKTDLTEVLNQLTAIVSKLDEISVSANKFSDVFKDGLNVNASVEEIDKLTNRVKELEGELAKIKTTTSTSAETNISSGNSSTASAEKFQQITSDTVNVLSDVGKTEDQIVQKIQKERAEAEANNEVLREHLVLLDKAGKVVANHWGSTSNVNGTYTDEQLSQAQGGKIIHAHPGKASFFGGQDLKHLLQDSMYDQIKQIDLIWGDSTLSVDKSTLTKESSSTLLNIMRNVRKTLTEAYGDNPDGAPSQEAREHINAIEKEIFKTIAQKLNVSVSEEGNMAKEVTDALSDVDKSIIKRFSEIKDSVIKDTDASSIIKNQMKDAFQGSDTTSSTVQKVADNFEEVKRNTDKSTEAAKDYIRTLSQVGEWNVDSKVSVVKERNDGQLESWQYDAKRGKKNITYDKNGNIEYGDPTITVISNYKQLEKVIVEADDKLRNLNKDLKDVQSLDPNASTSNIEKQIEYQKEYINLLEQTIKTISSADKYFLHEQQIADARAKAEKEYNLKQGTKSDISNAKQLASEEQKRQKNIEQTNRLLNRQQITIDAIEKSYNKAVNGDLDKTVNSKSDLKELEQKKNLIQFLMNGLKGEERNSSNEQEFLEVEKLIAEYKQLAKDKLKANNPSKQELGGQELDVLLASQVEQYNKLISQSEKYGNVTKDITKELKDQRDLIAEQNKDGVYVARSKRADGSDIKADDYYSARDSYKINKSILGSYENSIKGNSETAKQQAKEIQTEWDKNVKAIQNYMDAVTKLNNLKAKDGDSGKYAKQIQKQEEKVKELEQTANDAREVIASFMSGEKINQIPLNTWGEFLDIIKQLDTASQGSSESIAKLEDSLKNVTKSRNDYVNSVVSKQQNYLGDYQSLINRKDYLPTNSFREKVSVYEASIANLQSLAKQLSEQDFITKDRLNDFETLKKRCEEARKALTSMKSSDKGAWAVDVQKEIDKINSDLSKNTRYSAEAKQKLKAFLDILQSGNISDTTLKEIHNEFLKITNAEKLAGREGKNFFDILSNSRLHQMAAQIAGMFGVNDLINLGKQGFETIKELDYALVDLEKTTTMNSSELKNFYYNSNEVAKQMGVTTEEIIDQASSWSRLGYSTKEAATEMSKLSSQFASISPGMDVEQSQSGLVSIMKAWSLDYDQVKSEIMDPINRLGNTMALSNQDIVEGMQRSAAALAAVGTSTKDAFAMFSGIQEVLQNAEKSGTSLRSVALRLRSFDEETEEYSSDLSNITGELADLTKTAKHSQGISVFKDGSTTEFKDLTDYFREVANIWDEMSQKQQNDYLLKAFGRTQAQGGAALIQNFKGVDKALQEMEKSAGSADDEMSIIESSLTYKINALKETWVGTAQDILDRGDLSTIIDGLTKVSEVIGFVTSKLGLLKTAVLGIGVDLSLRGHGKRTIMFQW